MKRTSGPRRQPTVKSRELKDERPLLSTVNSRLSTYFPANRGSRFSIMALTPSRASAVVNVMPWFSDS